MQPEGQNRQLAMQAFAQRARQGGGVPTPPAPPAPQPGNQSAGGARQLQQSQPNEAVLIVKALIQRLRELTRAEFGGGEEQRPSQPSRPQQPTLPQPQAQNV